jgi:hypothetical protein
MRRLWAAAVVMPCLALLACGSAPTSEDIATTASPLVTPWANLGVANTVPPAVVFNNVFYLFDTGIGDGQAYWRTSNDGTSWGGWFSLDPNQIVTHSSLAPVVFNNTMYVFAQNASQNNEIYVDSTTNGTAWSGWHQALGGGSDAAIAPVVFLNKLYIFVKGGTGIWMASTTDGSQWTTWNQLPGGTAFAPSAAVLNGRLFVFVVGIGDSTIYAASTTDAATWTPWHNFGQTTGNGVHASVFLSDLWLTATGLDNPGLNEQNGHIYATLTRDPYGYGLGWAPWFELTPMSPYPAGVYTPLTSGAGAGATAFGNGLYWFVEGSDQTIQEESTQVYHLPFTNGTNWILTNANWDDPNGSAHTIQSGQQFAYDFGNALNGVFQSGVSIVAMRSGTVIFVDNNETCNTLALDSHLANGLSCKHDSDCKDNNGNQLPGQKCNTTTGKCQATLACTGPANMQHTGGTYGGPYCNPPQPKGDPPGYGNAVVIRHSDGSIAAYDHMLKGTVAVKVGQMVNTGDLLGHVGETGDASIFHVHVDIRNYWNENSPGFQQVGIDMPTYFYDKNHAAWRPQKGEADFNP